MQEKFECMDQIKTLLYGNIDNKFIVDPKTGKSHLNPDCIRNLNEFNTFKKMVGFCAQNNTNLIDVSLLKSLIQQVDLRVNILQLNRKHGIFDYPLDVGGE